MYKILKLRTRVKKLILKLQFITFDMIFYIPNYYELNTLLRVYTGLKANNINLRSVEHAFNLHNKWHQNKPARDAILVEVR